MENKYKTKFKLLALLLMSTALIYAQIPNPGFETWTGSGSNYNATSWGDLNGSTGILGIYTVQRATGGNVHSGTYAMKLYSQYVSLASETAPGIAATTSINTTTQAIQGGFPLNYRPYKFKGWFKYAPVSPDTFSAQLTLFSGLTTGPVIGTAYFSSAATVSGYTQFDVLVNYTGPGIPDSAQILLLSSSSSAPQTGSIAYVDDLSLVNCSNMAVSATPSTATCGLNDGSAVAVASGASGPYAYAWSNSTNSATLSNVVAASYTVVATDTDGCTASASVAISATNVSFSPGLTTTTSSCVSNTGTATTLPTGGNSPYTYVWSNTDTTHTITNLSPGNYPITVTDAHGCSATGTASVGTASGPSASDMVTNILCFGDSTGAVTVTVTGGTGNINYAWSNNASTQNLTGVKAGNYTLTITDVNSCSFTVSANVAQPSQLLVSDSAGSISCYGDSSGTIVTTATGGTPGYTYLWTNNSTNANLTGVVAGPYTVTVSDANSCTASITGAITQPIALSYTTSITNASTLTSSDGSVVLTPHGGTPPYIVSWVTGTMGDTLTHLAADTYTVTISDSLGCSIATYVVIGGPVAIGEISAPLVKIYPNPANAQLVIQTNTADNKYLFSLYSMDGQLVNEINLTEGKTSVNLQQLSAGLYTYRLRDLNSGGMQYGKIEVQH